MIPDSSDDPAVCPLCGDSNHCAITAGKIPSGCWCQDLEISAGALAAIPKPARGRRCLCPECARTRGEFIIAR